MAKEIRLTKGYVSIVDDEDYEVLSKRKWHCVFQGTFKYGRSGRIYMHRLIMKPDNTNFVVDHINHDTLDNRRCNLRICTKSENQKNKLPYKKVGSFNRLQWCIERQRK